MITVSFFAFLFFFFFCFSKFSLLYLLFISFSLTFVLTRPILTVVVTADY